MKKVNRYKGVEVGDIFNLSGERAQVESITLLTEGVKVVASIGADTLEVTANEVRNNYIKRGKYGR